MSFNDWTKVVGISSALVSAGAIASISAFTMPILEKAPASTFALHQLRTDIFQVGQFIFPTLSVVSGSSLLWLAYDTSSYGSSTTKAWTNVAAGASPVSSYYLAAAIGVLSIMPYTALIMFPVTNQKILQIEQAGSHKGKKGVEEKGGDERVQQLLQSFKMQNYLRAGLTLTGGVLGLYAALL